MENDPKAQDEERDDPEAHAEIVFRDKSIILIRNKMIVLYEEWNDVESRIKQAKKKMKAGDKLVLLLDDLSSRPYFCATYNFDHVEKNILLYCKGLGRGESIYALVTPQLSKCLDSIRLNSRTKKDPVQKEICGEFILKPSSVKSSKAPVEFAITNKRVRGNHEDVSLMPARFSFHTHPETAYLNHKKLTGFPSVSDIEALMKYPLVIIHCVVAVEGTYWISKGRCVKPLTKREVDVVEDIFFSSETPKEYTDRVNDLGLFRVKFIPWNKLPNSRILISRV